MMTHQCFTTGRLLLLKSTVTRSKTSSSGFRHVAASLSTGLEQPCGTSRLLSTTSDKHSSKGKNSEGADDHWSPHRVSSFVGHSFPDFIEKWNRDMFRRVGYGLAATTVATLAGSWALYDFAIWYHLVTPAVLGTATVAYWQIGLRDIQQTSHAIRRNYPVLGNLRYIFETIRPELHQYIVESDTAGRPFDRLHRAQIYQRAKNVDDTLPYGTRRDLYQPGHEWALHSMWPKTIRDEEAKRTWIGTAEYGTTQPYSASVLNISAMSYGALSDHAIHALSAGAKLGNFFHNTGEGGVSHAHLAGEGDLVWNIGTGYFGCGSNDTHKGGNRVFEPTMFQETVHESNGRIKMIEIKLSQGAKPGHGGLLPRAKITREIADARKLPFPPTSDCHSPASHSAFSNAWELVEFIAKVRGLSGGLPVGIKMCVGEPGEVATLCKAMLEIGNGPDFITVDGAEGGTGAAPPELSNSVGLPLEEGIVVIRNMLVGTNLRDKTRINASGRITSGFSLVKTIALGADYTCAARAFMMSLGCIQALKCNTNKCPTGIATQDKKLMYGLDPEEKSTRVYFFHKKTVQAASDIVGIMGYEAFDQVTSNDIMRRLHDNKVRTLSEHFPEVEPGSLLVGKASLRMQTVWELCSTEDVGNKTVDLLVTDFYSPSRRT